MKKFKVAVIQDYSNQTIPVAFARKPLRYALLCCLLSLPLTPVWADPNFTDNGDGTVTDKRSSLTWKRCAEGQTWTGSTCNGDKINYTGNAALKITSDFAGHTDWRVPSIDELKALRPFDGGLFPNHPQPYHEYWSSSIYLQPSLVWTMIFSDIDSGSTAWKNSSTDSAIIERALVRLVRGSRYIDHGDGTYTNKATPSLMWKYCREGKSYNINANPPCTGTAKTYSWGEGVNAAQSNIFKNSFAGHNDWRLPTSDELRLEVGEYSMTYLDSTAYNPYNFYTDPDYLRAVVGLPPVNTYYVALVRTVTAPAPTPAPQPTPAPTPAPAGFSIIGNEYNSPRNNKRLRAEISGSASTNAVYIWANVKGMGEFCYTPGTWTLFKDQWGATLSSGKNVRCPTPAGYLSSSKSGSSANIDVLNGIDLSSPLFNQSRVFVTLDPAGNKPTAIIRNQKIMEIGGSAWQ